MKFSIRVQAPAVAVLALVLAATAPAAALAQDKVISTQAAPATKASGAAADAGRPNAGKAVGTQQLQGAADPAAQAVRERFRQRFPDMKIDAIRLTPYGIYEVQLGMDLIYTDEKVGWVMEGPLIDAVTRRDMTRATQERLSAVSFDQLPLDLAIKQVSGDGSRKLAIFEDPNCGYCKQLRKTLQDETNLTLYTFMYPILSPDSKAKVRDVWCASDRAKAWDDWMLRGKTPASAQCAAPMDKLIAVGQRLMVRGTPTIIFADGRRVSGALPLEQLRDYLDTAQGG